MNIKLSSSLSIFIFFLPILRFRSHTLMASQKAYERKPHSYNLILCVTIRNIFTKIVLRVIVPHVKLMLIIFVTERIYM